MKFLDAGFLPKIIELRSDWLADPRVQRICSVSGCISEEPLEELEGRNQLHLFIDPDDAARSALADDFTLFGYRILDLSFEDGEAVEGGLPPLVARPVPPDWPSRGFDVVSRTLGISFDCSPLSCNGRAPDYPTNADCLLPTVETALVAAADFSSGGGEPGTYFILEVFEGPMPPV